MRARGISLGQEESGGWKRRSRADNNADLDITSMIDVTFLLLIFFMVTSTMQSEQALDIPTAAHGVNVEEAAAVMIEIREPLSIGAEPVVMIDRTEVALSEVPAIIREEMQKQKLEIVIKAAREVPHGFVRQVIQAANVASELNFSFGVEDKRGR